MIICLCEGVSRKEIEKAVQNGARDVEDIGAQCQAGQGCGACHEQISEIINLQIRVAPKMPCGISGPIQEINRVLELGVSNVQIIEESCYRNPK